MDKLKTDNVTFAQTGRGSIRLHWGNVVIPTTTAVDAVIAIRGTGNLRPHYGSSLLYLQVALFS